MLTELTLRFERERETKHTITPAEPHVVPLHNFVAS